MTDALVTLRLRLPGVDGPGARAWVDDLAAYLARRPGPQPTIEARAVSQTDSPDDGLHALLLDHRHGTDLSLFGSYAEARAALVEYVRYWWEDELPNEPAPTGDDAAVDCYFELLEDEDYRIEAVTVPDQPTTAVDPPPVRCRRCGRQLSSGRHGSWRHDWSKIGPCDPADPLGPLAWPTRRAPACRRCGSPLVVDGTCQDQTCPYHDRQQYQSFTEG